MKKIQTLVLTVALAFGVMAIVPAPVNAQLFQGSKREACKGANVSNNNGNCGTSNDLNKTIQSIVNLLTVIVGIVAVIMIIVNGFRFITSGGDTNAVTSARNGLIYAIVGLVIAAMAQIIVRYVINKI